MIVHLHGGPGDDRELPVWPWTWAAIEEAGYARWSADYDPDLVGVYLPCGERTHDDVPVGVCLRWRGWVEHHGRGVN